ncbi:fimbria/pilus outer membrane usher protein [Sphingobium algorifonticola]|uniref:Fimbrial biogenesis outer membrane usher protein n=1 Tax=Sphingobium algorifonticola TaxID=2008318 RepID=A0A437JDY3_9SPHN|nr:fimbria/pilus outer membrane usher protein [Sphingobium algorifonticola]RVT43822.1 fimbrial biogenesis outer membrane usher protein [Sphingobium algorifonticola]
MGGDRFWRCCRALWQALLALFLAATPAWAFAQTSSVTDFTSSATHLFLKVDVNGTRDGPVVFVEQHGDHFRIKCSDLRAIGLRLEGAAEDMIDVTALAGAKVAYDMAQQSLSVIVPPSLLPTQRLGEASTARAPAISGSGVLISYDLYAQTIGGRTTASLWSEQRLFGRFGTASNTGTVRLSGGTTGYLRYDTRVRLQDEGRALAGTVGDMVTGSLSWGNVVRMGGVQIGRNFRIRPDLVLTPLPQFAGQASVPSAVDLFINGQRSHTDSVRPGPFLLDARPSINGAGEAVVVTTDAVGRRIAASIPFYVSNDLLRPGLVDFSLEVGALRRDYGLKSFSYGMAAASGVARMGITRHLTLEAQGQMSRKVQMAGIGAVVAPGVFGTANLSVSASHKANGTSGRQVAIGYDYVGRRFGLSVQRVERSSGYRDLASFDLGMLSGARRSSRVFASASLDSAGSIGVGYIDAVYRDAPRTRLATASYTATLFGRLSLIASADVDVRNGRAGGQFRVLLPFGRSSLSAGVQRASTGTSRMQVDFARAIPSEGGLGVSASVAREGRGAMLAQGETVWRTPVVQLTAGGSRGRGDTALWASASGSLVMLGGQIMPTAQVSDAFALVSTDGMAGIPVYYENQRVGVSNRRGYAFVPGVTSHYSGRYSIDPMALDRTILVSVSEKHMNIRAGGGAVVDFTLARNSAISLTLTDDVNRPLPVGSIVAQTQTQGSVVVGWDGLLYLENTQSGAILDVRRADGGRCRAVVPEISAEAIAPPVVSCL